MFPLSQPFIQAYEMIKDELILFLNHWYKRKWQEIHSHFYQIYTKRKMQYQIWEDLFRFKLECGKYNSVMVDDIIYLMSIKQIIKQKDNGEYGLTAYGKSLAKQLESIEYDFMNKIIR